MRIKKLAKIFNSYQQQLYVCAIAITKNRETAEDAVHDALLAVAETHSQPLDLTAYLFKVVRTKALHLQQKNQRQMLQLSECVDTELVSHDDRYRCAQALGHIDAMTPEQQQILIMKLMGGLTFKEIAACTSTSINTVASKYRRALITLQEKLNE